MLKSSYDLVLFACKTMNLEVVLGSLARALSDASRTRSSAFLSHVKCSKSMVWAFSSRSGWSCC